MREPEKLNKTMHLRNDENGRNLTNRDAFKPQRLPDSVEITFRSLFQGVPPSPFSYSSKQKWGSVKSRFLNFFFFFFTESDFVATGSKLFWLISELFEKRKKWLLRFLFLLHLPHEFIFFSSSSKELENVARKKKKRRKGWNYFPPTTVSSFVRFEKNKRIGYKKQVLWTSLFFFFKKIKHKTKITSTLFQEATLSTSLSSFGKRPTHKKLTWRFLEDRPLLQRVGRRVTMGSVIATYFIFQWWWKSNL